jgi:hypothetical protein
MHRAPALSFPVGRSRFLGALVVSTAPAGTLVGVLWYAGAAPSPWRHWLFVLVSLAVFVMAFETWRKAPSGILAWDGRSWNWTGACAPTVVSGHLAVHLDLQFCLMLSLRPGSGARIWLCPERRQDVLHWNALRRAVFSRGGAGPDQAIGADAAGTPG